jgi:4-hydroxy-tetrahydrodipicolinate reductase
MSRVRVVHVGLGPIGREIARLAHLVDGYEIVGAADPASGLSGRDLGELLAVEPLGIEVGTDALAEVRRSRPDVVFHSTGSYLEEEAGLLRDLIECRVSVVSTCEELSFPFYRHPELSRELYRLAAGRGVVLLGTGVNPGFVLDKMAATLASACSRVDGIHASRVVDASTRRGPLQKKVGAGLTVPEFEERLRRGRFGHVGLVESAHMLADAIGVSGRRAASEEIRPRVAERPVETEHVRVEKGQVAGVCQVVVLEEGGRERVRLALEMYVGAEEPADVIAVRGEPPLEVRIPGGIPGDRATAAVTVNCGLLVPYLAPGLRTMLDVPLRSARQESEENPR